MTAGPAHGEATINGYCYRERFVTARKSHACDDYPRCTDGIRPGERYLECKEFPGHDAGWANAAGHPVVMRLCERSSTFQRRVSS